MKIIRGIALINTPVYNNDEGIYPPIGLISIATYLRDCKGYTVHIYDLAYLIWSRKQFVEDDFYLNFAQEIRKREENVIGITCQNFSLASALLLAKNIKAVCEDKYICLGGVGVHGIAKKLMEMFDFLDFIVIGEGEETTGDLLKAIENESFDTLLGVYFRRENQIVYNGNHPLINNLDKLPRPDFTIIDDVEGYFSLADNGRKALNVELARGCSGGCEFCGCFSFWCGQHRYFDINKMFDHIQQLIDQYEINHIYLSDDNFTSDNVMVERVCNKFRDRNWELTWDTRGRVNDMDLDLLRKMKQAGCSEILIGIESSDDFVLKNMNKRIISDQQYQAVINVMEAGIVPILSLILGYEGETESSINNTIHLV